MKELQEVPKEAEKPLKPIHITNCGELTLDDKIKECDAENLPMYKVDEYEERKMRKMLRKK